MLAVDTGGRGRFLVDTDDLHIGRSLFLARERQEMSVLERATAILEALDETALRGSTLVDVGANIGTTTVPGLVAGPFGRGVAIEPESKNFLTLRLNLLLNGLEDRVVARQAGASDEAGTARLVVTEGRSGNHRLAAGGADEVRAEVVEIETVTIDGLLREQGVESGGVGLLWVDAEGSEDRVLAGAPALLGRGTPLVLELSPKQVGAAGGSQAALEEAITRHYSHFVAFDVPPAHAAAGGLQSVAGLSRLAARVAEGTLGKKKLDILALDLSQRDYDARRLEALAVGACRSEK